MCTDSAISADMYTLIIKDESNSRVTRLAPHDTIDNALKHAAVMRRIHTLVCIEGPGGMILNKEQIAARLASRKFSDAA
jgi:hypothetical protein